MAQHSTRSSCRRGANLVEFALVLPILAVMAMGVMDYGWYYLRETMVTGALTSAVHAGTTIQPAPTETSGCTECAAAVEANAQASLQKMGIPTQNLNLTPVIKPLADTCAIELSVSIPHTPLLGFLPMPKAYEVNAVANAELVKSCP